MPDRPDRQADHGQHDGAVTRRRADPDRLVTFTDGVFAIIITILVLDIRVPSDLDGASLRSALGDVGPTLVAWIISFLLTGMFWVWHRDVFAGVREINRDVVWLNLLFLVPVSLIPFAASVVGEYDRSPIALHLYGAVLIMVSIMRAVLFRYLSTRPHLLYEPASPRAKQFGLLVALTPIGVYLIAMALADASPVASLALYGSMPLLYFGALTLLRDHSRSSDEADDYS